MNSTFFQLATTTAINQKTKFEEYFCKIVNKANIQYQTTFVKSREHFWTYLERIHYKFSKIRPVGFREQLDFTKVYIPLTLEIREGSQRRKSILVDKYPEVFKSSKKNILIVDNAGMGKSTISKRMFIGAFEDGSCGIPIFVELRHLTKDNDIIHEILNQIENLSSSFNEDLLLALIEKGGFVFFLDGYDEISISEKTDVTKSLQTFIDKAGKNQFILTSREDDALAGFQSFDQYSIKQLSNVDAFNLLSNLDNNGKKSQSLIARLKGEELASVKEFLTNPLLVTLLFTAFDYEPTIPAKKHLFYNQVYNAFFQQHDLSKGDDWCHDKKSKLPKDDFERVLSCIGFISILNHKVEFSESELLKTILIAKQKCNVLDFNEPDFLSDLRYSVPLFSKEGNTYKWVHKSMSEYFAVKYFTENTDEKNLVEKITERDTLNYNILDFYYDIKPSSFRQYLLLPFLNEVKKVLLPETEDVYKKILCAMLMGGTLTITTDLTGPSNSYILPGFSWKVKTGEEYEKFLPLCSFLYNTKHYLISEQKIDVEMKKLSNLALLLKKTKRLEISYDNIGNYNSNIVYEIIAFRELWCFDGKKKIHKLTLPYITSDICKTEIESVEKEINANKNLDSYSLF